MEQNVAAAMPVMDSGDKKGGNRLKLATVIASVVAICGIGFGIYGMMQSSQKDNQISDLEAQIKNNNLPTIAAKTQDDENVTEKEHPEDYYYFDQLGVKIHKQNNIPISYEYSGDFIQNKNNFAIYDTKTGAINTESNPHRPIPYVILDVAESCSNASTGDVIGCLEIGNKRINILSDGFGDSISEEFRKWITDPNNYSEI